MNFIKKVLISIVLLIPISFITINVQAATFYNDIKQEVSEFVTSGDLSEWHNNLTGDPGYQTFYTKMVRTSNDLSYFKTITEERLREIIQWYHTNNDSVWKDVIKNLDIEPQFLEPNKIVGIYWDSKIIENYSYLYLIWTSEYIPSEFMTIKEIAINNKTFNLYDNETVNWWSSDYYHYAGHNLTIYKTPISGYDKGERFGIPLTQKYHIKGFKAGLNESEYGYNPDPNGIYNITSDMEIEFDLGKVPTKDGVKLCQLVTHAYEIIKDCEVQSYFDIGFGGYIHQVLFNTTISIDKIYRVDVAYTLSSENKLWYQFWLNVKEEDVRKSLTSERLSGGFFNLFSYQGFQEGIFQSNIKNSKTYIYNLHLNYDESCWNLFDNQPYYEADYILIKNFRILRLNYLVEDKVYDVAVKMDTVDGETLRIVDRSLILDTDSITWKVKDKIFEVVDEVKDKLGKTGSILLAIGGAVIGVVLIYFVYKIILFISKIFKGGKT